MKRLIGTIAVLFLFLIFAFFRSTDQAKKNQIPTVGILQLTSSHPALDEIHRGIILSFKRRRLYLREKHQDRFSKCPK